MVCKIEICISFEDASEFFKNNIVKKNAADHLVLTDYLLKSCDGKEDSETICHIRWE